MKLTYLALILLVCSVGSLSTANASVLLSDDFDGDSGSALDGTKWLTYGSGAALDGASNALLDGANEEFESIAAFTYENLEFGVTNYTDATGIWGYDSHATNHVLIRPDAANALKIQVVATHDGFQLTEVALPTVSDFLVNIEWSATQLRVLIDGVEKLNLTDSAKIPQLAMQFRAKMTSASPAEVGFSHVQVGTAPVPEPGALGLFMVGGLLMLGKRARRLTHSE